MYQIEKLTKTYTQGKRTVHALRDVSLRIEDGELLSVQGPTGGGKSTLLQALGGLDRPTSGSVVLDGKDLATMNDAGLTRVRAETVGFVFQNFNLIPTLTAQENVETALVPAGMTKEERARRALDALESVGLGERADHLPDELSGGQQQRVAIARALVKNPTVLLADEPTGNLDEDTRDEIIDLLEGLWKEQGLTLVMVTHDSAVAARTPRRIRIAKGRLKELTGA
ncbi:ABC transporter ATP-binding protein [Myceligenerans pegani]|uniref:ABC transporter ATP-binding protein n=1 Tax=Myceligenerans pegani TaxID=2776917 RepID=A0ABR9MV61_9MICO|nr:ABC transporter ATP-binding protein [Myceligenerans sp. TRM 65318]MBE1874657.1 ABC transporter ATP-binding protein [Myceligenerans sp. TRM 65318]MBE3016928.1 ABC transporter ATP-binding protein [Myceligenerans sp. TRM 65318]